MALGDKKLKVAFLNFYGGVVARGVETYVHELANRLKKFGHEVSVYQTGDPLPGSCYRTVKVKVDINWDVPGSCKHFVDYYSLRIKEFTNGALRQLDKDTHVVVPASGDWQPLLCKLWVTGRGKKMVISGQSGPGADDKIKLLTFPSSFVALTEYQAAWARRFNPLVRVDKIPNGVDLKKFTPGGSSYNIKMPRPIILSVAALVSWKRLDLVLKAVSRLGKGSLLVVGKEEKKDPTKENLLKLGRSILPGRFEILSFPHSLMPEIYRACDLFTYSTVPWESFGIVLLEAMASGLGVVVVDDPMRREIVGDAGIFIDPEDSDKYASALEKALKTDWGKKPRRQAEKFSWDRIAEDYERLFLDIL